MVTQIFSNVSIASGGTKSATVDVGRYDVDAALFIVGDSNSADVTIEFYVDPDADVVGQFFHHTTSSQKNVDITSGETYHPTLKPADEVKVEVTNNDASATTINGWVQTYSSE